MRFAELYRENLKTIKTFTREEPRLAHKWCAVTLAWIDWRCETFGHKPAGSGKKFCRRCYNEIREEA